MLIVPAFIFAALEQVLSEKLEWKGQSKIGSLDNAQYSPRGGNRKIFSEKLGFQESAQSRVGSLDNADHQPLGGTIKVIFSDRTRDMCLLCCHRCRAFFHIL